MKKLCHPSNNILIVSNLLLVFFLPGALAHCGSSLTQHMHTPPEIEALIGSCVEIPCRFDTLPGFDISKPIFGIWMKNKASHHEGARELIFNSSGSINTHQMELTGDLTAKNCSTRIPDLTADHTDKYFLRIENGATTATFCDDPFTLTVNDSPWTPIIVVSGRNLREHQSVTITCSAYTPCLLSPPELTWNLKKDSSRQIEKSTDGTLTSKLQESITLSDEHDGYTINCTARYPVRNGFKQAESTKLLNVLYAPRNTSASISPSALVSVGSRVELSCSSRAKPPPSFSWFRKERQRFIKESSEQAYSFSASLQETYECEAQNTLGREESEPICIDIIGAPVTPIITIPRILLAGKTVPVTCSASTRCQNSLPELTWNLQEDSRRQTKRNADGTFTTKIQENITLTPEHDGYNISCSSRHPLAGQNIVVKNQTLNVRYAPRNISVSIRPSQLVHRFTDVSGTCTARGNPTPEMSWVMSTKTGYVRVSAEATHWYTADSQIEFYCRAFSTMGDEHSDLFCIDIIDLPLTPTINIPSGELVAGQTVTITCSASSGCPRSRPELTWNLGQDSLIRAVTKPAIYTSEIQKNITLTDKHDGYIIICSSRHPLAGQNNIVVTKVTLNVLYAPRNTSVSIHPSDSVLNSTPVIMTCSSRAKPPPRFEWFKKDKLEVKKVSESYMMEFIAHERGDYHCVATNRIDSEKSESICIDLIDHPFTPTINIPSVELVAGQTVTITCSASSCPRSRPELTWNLGQDSLRRAVTRPAIYASEIQKNITLTDKHDGYNIICSARHPLHGQRYIVVTNVTLNVLYAPKETSASISPSGLVSAGSRVELSCSSRAKPPPSFTWFRISEHGDMNVSVGKVYNFSATRPEKGEYYCEATNEISSEKSTSICIDISDLPLTPTINIPSVELVAGQTVTITCSASSRCPRSRPDLTWNLGQDSLRRAVTRPAIYASEIQKNITLTDKHDGYIIICSSRHPLAGQNNIVVTNVTLNVLYAPKETSASISPSGLVSAGSRVELSCSSRAKPQPRFTWFRISEHGDMNVSVGKVYNFSATRPEEGEYYCEATNEISSEKSTSICIDISDHPLTPTINIPSVELVAGQTVTITCSASSRCPRSRPELTWNLGQDSLRRAVTSPAIYASEIQKNITLTDKHDGYIIICSSRHPLAGQNNIVVTNVTLNVLYGPKETSASISPSGLVSAGSRVELSCSSRAKPPPSFTWFRISEHGDMNVSVGKVYNFSATRPEEGEYYCEATNEISSEKSTSICIDISDAPLTPRISISTYTLKERQSVTVTCSASTRCPNSPPELTWNLQQDSPRQTEKNTDGTFTTKIQTTITLTDTHDGYNIRCSARYPMAEKSKTEVAEMTLNVPYAPKNTLASINPSAGTLVKLSCSSRAKPPPKITWFKKGPKGITKVATGNSLKVEFTEGDEYYCVAANKLGKQKSSPINLTVKGSSGPEVWILALIGAVGIILLVIIVLIYDNFKSS